MTLNTLTVGFAGTPEFARVALEHLLNAGYPVKLVLTQPERPAGRGLKLTASPVKQLALEHGIPVLQPVSLKKGDEAEQALQALKMSADGRPLDVLIVAAYGLILPQAVLDAPRLGCLNIHGSLLPRWRGAAPIHRAIEAGDAQTGVCIMQMEPGLDTGPVGLREALPILPSDTTATLHDKLAELGGRLMVQALNQLAQGTLHFEVQSEQGVTYADKISKAEGEIDWAQPASVLQRRLRAFDPFPGASTHFRGELLKCFDPVVEPCRDGQVCPGTVLVVDTQGMVVQCGEGALRVATLQKAGSRRAPALQVAQAMGLQTGNCLTL